MKSFTRVFKLKVFILIAFLTGCNKYEKIEGICKDVPQAIVFPIEKNSPKNSLCSHPLMTIRVLPHSEEYERTQVIKYCYYEFKDDTFRFYEDAAGKVLVAKVNDRESIIW